MVAFCDVLVQATSVVGILRLNETKNCFYQPGPTSFDFKFLEMNSLYDFQYCQHTINASQ